MRVGRSVLEDWLLQTEVHPDTISKCCNLGMRLSYQQLPLSPPLLHRHDPLSVKDFGNFKELDKDASSPTVQEFLEHVRCCHHLVLD